MLIGGNGDDILIGDLGQDELTGESRCYTYLSCTQIPISQTLTPI
ncbi:hypothetical protein [Planktothrix agardhii]